jgi:hypothetical protein
VRALESGFRVPGQARDVARVRCAAGDAYVVTRNNDGPLLFRATRARSSLAVRPEAGPAGAGRTAR